MGQFTAGPKNPNGKLDWALVRQIRSLHHSGQSQGSLAREYKVSINTIGRIVRGESWQEEGMVLGKGMTEGELQDAAAASFKRLQGLLAQEDEPKAASQPAVFVPSDNSPVPAADKPPMSLEELMRRESERPDPEGERAIERLNGEAKQADGGLGELLGPVMPK